MYIESEDYDYFDLLFNGLDRDRSYAFLDLLLKAGSEKTGTDVFVIEVLEQHEIGQKRIEEREIITRDMVDDAYKAATEGK